MSPGLAALGQGNWVSVPASELTGLLQGRSRKLRLVGRTPTPSDDAADVVQLTQAFTANATYAEGRHPGKSHPLHGVARGQARSCRTWCSRCRRRSEAFPGASSVGKQINGAISKIPANQKLVADVWVRDNKAQEIDIDLNQFDHKYAFAVPLRIQIGPGAPVIAPVGRHPPQPLEGSEACSVGGMLERRFVDLST